MHLARPRLAELDGPQRLRQRYLKDGDLVSLERLLRNAMSCLHDGGLFRLCGGGQARCSFDQPADVECVDAGVGSLVNHLHHVAGADEGQCDL